MGVERFLGIEVHHAPGLPVGLEQTFAGLPLLAPVPCLLRVAAPEQYHAFGYDFDIKLGAVGNM